MIGGEIEDGSRDFIRPAVASERNLFIEELGAVPADDVLQILLDRELEAVVDRSGMDRIHANAAGSEFLRETAHQADLGMLRGDVGIDARVAPGGRDARVYDDAAAVVHLRDGVFAQEKCALDVHRIDGVEDVLGIARDRLHDAEIAGIAEHDVDLAPALGGRIYGLLHAPCIGDVGDDIGDLVAVGSVASLILPLAIDRVLTRWPNLRVQIIEGVGDRLAEALIKHEIDLALGVYMQESEEICPIADCSWEDSSYVVASVTHPLRQQCGLKLADTIHHRWAIMPRGTPPFEQMQQMFRSHGLGLPNVTVETRSIIALKSLVTCAGYLSWMPEPMYDAERKAHLIEALPIPDTVIARSLTAFRRRRGILPAPAVKLLEELRQIIASSRNSASP